MMKYNRERLRDIKKFHEQYVMKETEEEKAEFMSVLNAALMKKYGENLETFEAEPVEEEVQVAEIAAAEHVLEELPESADPADLISFSDKGLTDLTNAFYTKHNLDKILEVSEREQQHDELETAEERAEFVIDFNLALKAKYGEDVNEFGCFKLAPLLTAFFMKHNHEKLSGVHDLEADHDKLATDQVHYPPPLP